MSSHKKKKKHQGEYPPLLELQFAWLCRATKANHPAGCFDVSLENEIIQFAGVSELAHR